MSRTNVMKRHRKCNNPHQGPISNIQDPKPVIQDPGSNIQGPGSKIQGPRSEFQDPRSNIPGPRSKVQYPRPKIQYRRSKIECPRRKVQYPGSKTQSPRSNTQEPRAKIQGPNSKFKDPRPSVTWLAHRSSRSDAVAEMRRASSSKPSHRVEAKKRWRPGSWRGSRGRVGGAETRAARPRSCARVKQSPSSSSSSSSPERAPVVPIVRQRATSGWSVRRTARCIISAGES